MSARQLLELIHERGGVATVKQGGAAPQIQITPRGLVSDLASEIQKFKPALLELIAAPEPPAPSASPFRRANEFVFVPLDFQPAPGAARIAATLQSFEPVFTAARRGDLPDGCEPGTGGAICELEKAWSDRARNCQRARRDLTGAELSALEMAAAWLESAQGEAPEVRR